MVACIDTATCHDCHPNLRQNIIGASYASSDAEANFVSLILINEGIKEIQYTSFYNCDSFFCPNMLS